MGEELWKNTFMILVGSSGEKWEVSILKKGNDIYLQIGWQKFLIDNKVMLEELLVFTYDGENKFQAQIFGKNGLERPCFKNVQEQEEIQEEEVTAAAPLTVAKRKRGRPRKVPSPESECFKKEKAEVAAKIVVKRNDGRTRKSPAGERVCFRKKEVAATIMSMGKPRKNPVRQRVSVKKGRTRENPAVERVRIMKEEAKSAETMVAERKNGRPRKYPAPIVILVN